MYLNSWFQSYTDEVQHFSYNLSRKYLMFKILNCDYKCVTFMIVVFYYYNPQIAWQKKVSKFQTKPIKFKN